MQNFKNPFQARSLPEFWRRWHISLSTWFRDYLYIPMGGNRVSVPKHLFNLFIVFVIGGLWHGANWVFIIWGALHGFYLVFGALTEKLRNRIMVALRLQKYAIIPIISTFTLVSFACIFFRKETTVDNALYIATHIFSFVPDLLHFHHLQNMGVNNVYLVCCMLLIIFLELVQYLDEKKELFTTFLKIPLYQRWAVYYIGLFLLGMYGIFEHRQFIYFQF
jgi:D-alanyl-lipoteichoic acid acyltransferase DltB (MBOAT superfamily)